jgi:transposase-like protein
MSDRPVCPFCDRSETTRVGQWGGQIITAQWHCQGCNSYFEALREEFDDAPGPATKAISFCSDRK